MRLAFRPTALPNACQMATKQLSANFYKRHLVYRFDDKLEALIIGRVPKEQPVRGLKQAIRQL